MNDLKVSIFILIVGIALLYSVICSRKKRVKNGETYFKSSDATSYILGIGFIILGFFKIIMFFAD
jgi:hypothetical protein